MMSSKRQNIFRFVLIALFVFTAFSSSNSIADDLTFAVSLGWTDNPSGQALKRGFEDAIKEFGGKAIYQSAEYDPKTQSEQIENFIKMKPAALFVTASDTKGITAAVKRAVAEGIPVFCGDSLVAGSGAITTIMSNNFGMGVYTGEFIAKRLNGKGKVAVIDLPANETWDMRSQGFYWAMRNYPEIQIITEWSYISTGEIKPRQQVDEMLTKYPKGQLDAIWCAWDGAAMEGALAAKSAGRDEIITTGIDGGVQAFEYIKSGRTAMKLTMAQSMYSMSYMLVYYAHKYLNNEKVPRLVISPVYAVTQDVLKDAPKDCGKWYDHPDAYLKLGWKRVL